MKLYKFLGIAALMAGSLTSCTDFLTPEDKTNGSQNADQYLSENPESLLPVVYSDFQYFATQIELNEEATDLYYASGDDDGYGKFEFNPEDGGVQSFYTNAYNAINHANGLIQYGGEGSLLAQKGRFFRGLGYYYLTQQFGGVPLVMNYIADSRRDYPRASLEEVYTTIIADLEDLYTNSQLAATNNYGDVSKQAVAALLAKFYLAAGWDLQTTLTSAEQGTYNVASKDYFTKAAQWAEKAINGQKLTQSYAQLWDFYNQQNAENIFTINYRREGNPAGVNSGHSLQNQYTSYFGNMITKSLKGTRNGGKWRTSMKAINLWNEGDERYDATFMLTYYNAQMENADQSKWGKGQGYMAYYLDTPEDQAKLPVAYLYYPSYMTEAEVEADIASHKSQLVPRKEKLADGKPAYAYQFSLAFHMQYPNVTKYEFNDDGSVKTKTPIGLQTFLESPEPCGFSVRKWDDLEQGQTNEKDDYRCIPLLQLGDMYLIAAEAYLMAGDEAKALQYVNDVRNRAKAGALASFSAYSPLWKEVTLGNGMDVRPLDVILDERGRELYAQRTRFEDLRRTKQLIRYNLAFSRVINDASQMKGVDGEFKWYRPIPANEMNYNTAMKPTDQNPGYVTAGNEPDGSETPAE